MSEVLLPGLVVLFFIAWLVLPFVFVAKLNRIIALLSKANDLRSAPIKVAEPAATEGENRQ